VGVGGRPLLDPEDEGTAIHHNVGNYLKSTRCNDPEDLNRLL
jgi:hypothetical protein